MGKIIELSQQVANQIAAGEVVERPASVVKELVENSIDAQACNIEVRIKNGGYTYIVVQDDGVGMDEHDVKLAIKRYATSKLTMVSDLYNLHTFGFRGEALPSIASVSHLSISTRLHDEEHGTKAMVEAGEIRDFCKSGAQAGSRIEVRDLFFNVPARLKFAKSKGIETAEIDRLLRAFAFAYQNVGWRFFVDDKLVFSCLSNGDSEITRAELMFGDDARGYLYDFKKHSGLLTMSGVIGAPTFTKRDSRGLVFFVNDRLVSDKKLIMAVRTAFRSLLEVGCHPVCALKICLAPDEVDVNVHPRKAEVRFRDERQVISAIIGEVGNFLSKTPWLSAMPKKDALIGTPRPIGGQSGGRGRDVTLNYLLRSPPPATPQYTSKTSEIKALALPIALEKNVLLRADNFSSLRAIGQVCATYLLAEGDQGLVVIDQHAAHERIMYERIRERKTKVNSSSLLIPITVSADLALMALFEEHQEDLKFIGIEAEKFGETSIVVRSLPDFVKNIDVKALMQDILSDLANYGHAERTDEMLHHLSATVACHSSIRAGQRLSQEEIAHLLAELDSVSFGAHCPHGRPIVKSITQAEMKKWFDRT